MLVRSKDQLHYAGVRAWRAVPPPVNPDTGRFLLCKAGLAPPLQTFPAITSLTLHNHLQRKMSIYFSSIVRVMRSTILPAPADCLGALVEQLRLLVLALDMVESCQVAEAGCCVRMLWT